MEPAGTGRQLTRTVGGPSERVVEAVAEREGCDPTQLHPPLYSAVDPDALDLLVSGGERSRGVDRVHFTYLGHDVVVRRDGSVAVDGE